MMGGNKLKSGKSFQPFKVRFGKDQNYFILFCIQSVDLIDKEMKMLVKDRLNV